MSDQITTTAAYIEKNLVPDAARLAKFDSAEAFADEILDIIEFTAGEPVPVTRGDLEAYWANNTVEPLTFEIDGENGGGHQHHQGSYQSGFAYRIERDRAGEWSVTQYGVGSTGLYSDVTVDNLDSLEDAIDAVRDLVALDSVEEVDYEPMADGSLKKTVTPAKIDAATAARINAALDSLDCMSGAEAAAYADVSKSTVSRALDRGDLAGRRTAGGDLIISRKSVEALWLKPTALTLVAFAIWALIVFV